jgi:hypothetical protein
MGGGFMIVKNELFYNSSFTTFKTTKGMTLWGNIEEIFPELVGHILEFKINNETRVERNSK